jgi:SAM-dependent methyltransferase
MKRKGHFPEGATLESELHRVIDSLASTGINYPPGYYEMLIRKYKKHGVRYPRILMRAGDPRIRKHDRYQEILQRKGSLLDYGCGTGDDIRALVKDGYPQEKIVGYDVNWSSINLGFDLYLDKDTWIDRFVVSKKFPFQPSTFDAVYSGSVLHVLDTKRAVKIYVSDAYSVLKPTGVFFGSTLGLDKEYPRSVVKGWKWRRLRRWIMKLLSQEALQKLLVETGFSDVEVSQESGENRLRLWFYAKKP